VKSNLFEKGYELKSGGKRERYAVCGRRWGTRGRAKACIYQDSLLLADRELLDLQKRNPVRWFDAGKKGEAPEAMRGVLRKRYDQDPHQKRSMSFEG